MRLGFRDLIITFDGDSKACAIQLKITRKKHVEIKRVPNGVNITYFEGKLMINNLEISTNRKGGYEFKDLKSANFNINPNQGDNRRFGYNKRNPAFKTD